MDFWGYFQISNSLLITAVILIGLYVYYTWNFNYWKSQNVPRETSIPFMGATWKLLFRPFIEVDMEIAKKTKDKVWGVFEFRQPALIVRDLDIIKEVTIKEFHNYADRRKFPVNPSSRIARYFLTVMEGEPWKIHRSFLTPIFTSGKLRQVCALMDECGNELVSAINACPQSEKDNVNLKMKFSVYAMDVIATCCFGYKINTRDPDDPFIKHAKTLFSKNFMILGFLMLVWPKSFEIFDISFFDSACINYFHKVVNKVVGMRRQENTRRGDFLQLLLDAQQRDAREDSPVSKSNDGQNGTDIFDVGSELSTKKSNLSGKQVLTEEALAAHVTLFLLAGFDTTANTMAFAAYLLALNPECQDKLHQEIDEQIQKHGKLTSEVILEMKYLEMVLAEALRYFPPAPRLERRCTRDCELRGIKLKKDMMVSIPVYAIHHSEEYYPNPEKFDPERFTAEKKAKRNPMTYMPFGMGPRNCIGMRFALQEAKIGLAHLFTEYRVSPSSKTEIPIQFKAGLPLLLPVNGVFLKIEKRK